MKINDMYWKWKRFFHKNKGIIGRAISITMIVLVVAAVGYLCLATYQLDKNRDEIANADKDKTTIKANSKYNYGEPGFNKVAENNNYVLSADFTTGEISVMDKTTGETWYSNPQDRDGDQYVTKKNTLSSQFYVKFVNLEKGVKQELDSYGGSVKKGGMRYELIDNGIKFTFGFPVANVYIPVQYTLCEDGFQAEIITEEIKGVGYNPFMLESIALLPFFGAGGLEDEGYLMVPDGSGALIEYNNDKQSKQVYNAMVYGNNPTLKKEEQETVRETVALPVFGAKNNNNAFFAIITNGDATSTITATTSRRDSAYNHVYANVIMSEYDLTQHDSDHLAQQASHNIDYRDNLLCGDNYAVRYFFLSGEDADYAGMSNLYKDYLVKNGGLKTSELTNKKYVVLDLIGAVSIEKYVVGVKMPVVTALTTYNEVCQIVKELKEQGVENLIVNYVGALDSGLNNKLYTKVKPESVLGSKKDFNNMIEYLEQEGVLLFMETNPVDLYNNGNGFNENRDSVKSFFDQFAFQYRYELDVGTQIDSSRWHLLQPKQVAELTEEFASTLSKWNLDNISLSRLGETIYSDYTETGDVISRHQALDLWKQALSVAKENSKYLLVHSGNAYCSSYADVVTDVPNANSSFEMEDQSIPFYQMVFQSNTLVTTKGINTSVDYEYAFLKALETGSSLKYNLIYGDVSQLVGSAFDTMVSYSYDYWKAVIAEQNKAMQDAVAKLAGKEIVGHEYLTDYVTKTVYEDAEVVINYGTQAYIYGGKTIAPRGYLVLSGGAA